jgi:phospholipase C
MLLSSRTLIRCARLLVLSLLALAFAGCGGSSDSTPPPPPAPAPTASFSADPATITAGSSTTLKWTTTNASSVSISPDPGAGTLPTSGSVTVKPTQTTDYTLTANGAGGSTSVKATVTVNQPVAPTVTISADPMEITQGQLSTLSWTSTNADTLTITPDIRDEDTPNLATSGTATVGPTTTTTYTATAKGPGGSASASVTVKVISLTLNFSAQPDTINPGGSSTLSWTSSGISSLTIDNGVGDVSSKLPDGSVTVSPSTTTTYTATGSGSAGTITKTVVVSVANQQPSTNPIKHIIFMLQENRSFDDYFGVLGAYRASRVSGASPSDVDGFDPNVELKTKTGKLVKPYHYQTVCTENLSPSWNESHHDVHLVSPAAFTDTDFSSATFKMDLFLETTNSVTQQFDPDGTRPMGYYDQTDLPFYYELASQFATSDRFFSPVLSNTIPNRMYLFTGTSFGHIRPDPTGHVPYSQKTIFRALNEQGVSWRYYYQDSSVFLADFQDWSDPKIQGKVYNIQNWFDVLASGTADRDLPKVIFIERGGNTAASDEHPLNNVQKGAATVQNIIDALMKSDAWKDSVFILTYDEGGGLYDHVRPIQLPEPDGLEPGQCPDEPCPLKDTDTQGHFNLSGFRVPLIVISPFTKPHFVSHTPMDFTAILKFIETTFSVPSLTARDANAPDMTEFFDFSNPALLSAPGGANWADVLPQQPTGGTCDKTTEAGPTF